MQRFNHNDNWVSAKQFKKLKNPKDKKETVEVPEQTSQPDQPKSISQMNKTELEAALTEKGIDFSQAENNNDLKELLKNPPEAPKTPEPTTEDSASENPEEQTNDSPENQTDESNK